MKWWEITSNCNCIFSIDSESIVTPKTITYSSNSLKLLTAIDGDNLISVGKTSGLIYKNYKHQVPITSYFYKSLNIKQTNLLFKTPILLPNEFTFIMKAVIYSSSLWLSNAGTNYGLTFGIGTGTTDSHWRIDGYETGADYPKALQDTMNTGNVHTVILKGNLAAKEVDFVTEYGTYRVPMESTSFQKFLQSQTYSTLGYNTGVPWRPHADVIAYGLFDKVFTQEEQDLVLKTIDTQFLIKEIPTYKSYLPWVELYKTSVQSTLSNFKPLEDVVLNIKFSSKRFNYSPVLKNSPEISKIKTEDLLYKNYEEIFDIVLEEGLPVQTKLYLYEKETGYLIKTTISDKSGNFSFHNLKKEFEYIVTANDPKYQFQSIIKNYNN